MEEQWKPIKQYEAFYEISDKGRVRSLRTGVMMKARSGRDGYVRVPLTKDGKQKHKFLHRLLAIAFIPNPDNLPEVNHINENKQDNSLSNKKRDFGAKYPRKHLFFCLKSDYIVITFTTFV